jgi:probable HAF family extracellular repeat protein
MTSGHWTFSVIALAMVSQTACDVVPADEAPAPPGAEVFALGQVMAGEDDVTIDTHGFLRDEQGDFTTIEFPGAPVTEIRGINKRGQMVGDYGEAAGPRDAFVLDDGTFTPIEVPGSAAAAVAFEINSRGQIVGFYDDAEGIRHGWLLDDGEFSTIDPPGAASLAQALAINKHGQIVGNYIDEDGVERGFLLDDGTFTDIEVPDAIVTSATDIDDEGRIVGASVGADGISHGFVLDNAVFTAFDAPGATLGTVPFGINRCGQISGLVIEQVVDGQAVGPGFVLSEGTYTTFQAPDAVVTVPFDIDDRGRTVGAYISVTGDL